MRILRAIKLAQQLHHISSYFVRLCDSRGTFFAALRTPKKTGVPSRIKVARDARRAIFR